MSSRLFAPLRIALFAGTISLAALAGCDTAEERAEEHFKSGMALLEAGDTDRALVEFRNVFKLNGSHREARLAYAKAERDRGRLREAYAQYLRLVEQYPEDLAGQRALAEIAAQSGDWEETERHVTAALAIDPNDPISRAAQVVVEFGRAKEKGDLPGMAAIAARAVELQAAMPENPLVASVIINDALTRSDYDTALVQIDKALEYAPEDRALYGMRLSTLAAKGDEAGVESGLTDMVSRFPTDPDVSETLVRWYVSRQEIDKAEKFLRSRVGSAGNTDLDTLSLVRFLAEFSSFDAAIAELDATIASGRDTPVFRSTRAGLLFEAGKRDEAISEMEAVLAAAEPSEDTQRIKVGLARMLISNGNAVGARALVEEVLAEDADDLEAMKLKANWLILSDQVGEAISILRRALDESSRDAEVMTLMAQAHERDGNRELMRDMLSLAVEASGNAPAESLRYAQALAADGEYLTAESILIDALRLAPGTPGLLVPLGQIYIQIKDWPRAEAVAAEIEALNNPDLLDAVAGLRASVFEGQQKTDQAIGYLQGLVDEGAVGLTAQVAIIRSHLASGDNAAAIAYARKLLADSPEDPSVRFLAASVEASSGDIAVAEKAYRDLLAEDGKRAQVWMALYRIVGDDPARQEEAGTLLEEALAQVPDVGELKWAKAGHLERNGKIDEAIAVYEDLYAENSTNMIVANNLASLISSYRTDEASIARAEVIARRLRGSSVPAYNDTYGWIAYRIGRYADAEKELVKAAAGLPQDPLVQHHLAMTYLALDKKDAAAAQFAKVLALVPADDTRDFAVEARAQIEKLSAEGVEVNN